MNIDKQQMDLEKAIKAYMSKSDEGGNWTERVCAGLLAAAPFLQERTPTAQPQSLNVSEAGDIEQFTAQPQAPCVVKNVSTPQGKEFWNHVDSIGEQARAEKAQPQAGDVVNCECHIDSLLCTVPGHGHSDVIEKMYQAFDDAGGTSNYRNAMTAAQAVAREGYVGLEDVEKAIKEELPSWSEIGYEQLVKRIRSRLTPKPPERVDPAVEAVQTYFLSDDRAIDGFYCKDGKSVNDVASEIVAAVDAARAGMCKEVEGK